MTLLSTTAEVAALCTELAREPYVAVDTEFMRDRTYWPKLCLVQLAGAKRHAAIDPLATGIDLAPLFALMVNPQVLKVFHAARQDIEVFHRLTGEVPTPLFDTQLAADGVRLRRGSRLRDPGQPDRQRPSRQILALHGLVAAGRCRRSSSPMRSATSSICG